VGTNREETAVPDGVSVPDEVPFELKERAIDEAPVGITISDPDLPDNPLIYINDAFERVTGYDTGEVIGTNCRFLQGADTSPEPVRRIREAIAADEPVSVELVNYRKNGEPFWNQLEIAPVRDEEREVTNYVGFQMDVTERKRAEFAVERYAEQLDRERAALDRVLDRVNGLVGDVAETLVRASTRTDVEQGVCDLVADTGPFVGAWIGELDLASEAVEVSATAGRAGAASGATIPLDGDATSVTEAIETGDLQVASLEELSDVHGTGGAGVVAVIPLVYRDTRYGVLTVYTDDDSAIDEREQSVLAGLGRMIATAINAVETKEILTAEDVVALELSVQDPDLFFVGLSAEPDCTLTHAGSVWRDDSLLVFFAVEGRDPDDVVAAARRRPDLDDANVITETEDGGLVEFVVAGESVLTELAAYGARIRELSAESGAGLIRVEVSHDSAARSVVSLVTETYERSEMRSYRELERSPTTKGEFLAELRDRLTERQLTALRKAHLSGYFDWPRRTDGDALAASMGISRSTFHQHLRAANRKLVSELFVDVGPTS